MDTDGEEKESRKIENFVFLTSGGEATNLEKIEALYAYVRSWYMEEEDNIPLPDCKGVD